MSTEPLVSVILPVFNRAHCIRQAVESVLGQSYPHVEVLVVDDGSTDETAKVVHTFGSALRLLQQPNRGPSAARNTGWRSARGDLIAFLDSDDVWEPAKLALQVPAMDNLEVVFSATNWVVEGETKKTGFDPLNFQGIKVFPEPWEVVARPGGHRMFLSSWLVRRSILERLGGFDHNSVPAEDNHLLYRMAFHGHFALLSDVLLRRAAGMDEAKLTRLGELAYERRVTRGMSLALADARVAAFEKPPHIQKNIARFYAHYLRREAELAALDGRLWSARRRAFESLTNRPPGHDGLLMLAGLISPRLLRWWTARKFRGQI